MKVQTPTDLALLAGLAVAGALLFFVARKGGLAQAAAAAGTAAVDAVGDFTAGAVGAVGQVVGLPTPAQTTTDARVARWIIDHPYGGYFEASQWAGAPALLTAATMASGTGSPPPGGELLARFPVIPQASYDETDRLAKRYPAPVELEQDRFDALGNFTGRW